ncbi:MAG: hypothetical protein HY647_11075 [Acidobacteria bacterium]|nr:hypothetical protein [Acidobacteriota bacterium]
MKTSNRRQGTASAVPNTARATGASAPEGQAQTPFFTFSDWASLGAYGPRVQKRLEEMQRQQFAWRFWQKDPTLWKTDEASVQAIRNRLGWLTAIEPMQAKCASITGFADQVRAAGFTHVVLLGMGGSSLCAEVFRRSFGVAPGYLDLAVLDSTDPAAVRSAQRRAPVEKTLFLVATKSGTTTETLCGFRYFYQKVEQRKGERAGENFVAITDPGSPLVKLAAEKRFRRTFLNPSDIGGRFSVLSYFGLVPAALLGIDIRKLLQRAGQFLPKPALTHTPEATEKTEGAEGTEFNPAIQLGAILGELALAGRDKVTIFLSAPIAAFGFWVEQLIAESTGKEGQGLFPVHAEPPGKPEAYGPDRVFVHLQLQGCRDAEVVRTLRRLENAGHPVLRWPLRDRFDLGAEFFRWEIATAVAATLLKVNAFDEPDVNRTKENTARLLAKLQPGRKAAEPVPLLRGSGIRLYGARDIKALQKRLAQRPARIQDLLRAYFGQAKPGDYVALLAFLAPSLRRDGWFKRLRVCLRDALGVATSAGYGPRYLHSTGQFHKGGTPKGWLLEITADTPQDLPIPDQPYTFGQLEMAQAQGDLEALQGRKRPVLRLHLEGDADRGLRRLARWIEQGLRQTGPSGRRKRQTTG